MKFKAAAFATALVLLGCQRSSFTFTPTPTPTPGPAASASPGAPAADAAAGQAIFQSGNGNGTPGCVTCHPGKMLSGITATQINNCISVNNGNMGNNFGPNGAAPLSQAQINDIAAYLATL